MFLYRVVKALQSHKVKYAIVGGYAVALHGAVRGTVDLDLILSLSRNQFIAAEAAFKKIGLECRLPITAGQVFDFREEYIKNKNLVAWSFYNPTNPSEIVDIILTHDLAKIKTQRIKSDGTDLHVISIADLIRMKEQSGRPQDLEDVKALKRLKS